MGVHIADVTYFVEAGSALDEEAANRSTRSAGTRKWLHTLYDLCLDACVGIVSSQLCVSVCLFGCGCSTYLVQKRLDMLPKILTETLCSLTGKAEHFAFR